MVVHQRRINYTKNGDVDHQPESPMQKALCVVGIVIAVLLLVVFGFDLGLAFPFHRISPTMDIGVVLCCLALGYVSWTTLKEQK